MPSEQEAPVPAAALPAQGRDLLLGALVNPSTASASTSRSNGHVHSNASRANANGSAAPEDLLSAVDPTTASAASTANGTSTSLQMPHHEVHWEGYVRKKGDWLPRWEERYLILDGAALTYYNTKDEARSGRNLRGRMLITKVRPENYGKAHGFLIETKGHKCFHLCCTTELEKDMWVEMMQAAIDDHEAANAAAGNGARSHATTRSMSMSSSSSSRALGAGAGNTAASVDGIDMAGSSSVSSLSPPMAVMTTQVDLRSFYFAFRQLLISHSSSPQFFPKLSRDVVLTSNYAPTVPFWGEYHGLDGVLHFFSILYETVEFTAFLVTDIAQATAGSTAVVAGRETMKNRDNGRTFTQQWQHTIEFAPDGRVKSLTITADPIAASAVFGCNATSSLSLPTMAAVSSSSYYASAQNGNSGAAGSSGDHPAGTLHVVVFRGEQISNRKQEGDSTARAGSAHDSDNTDENDEDENDEDDDGDDNSATYADDDEGADGADRRAADSNAGASTDGVFVGLRLLTDGKTNVYAPSSSTGCLARTSVASGDSAHQHAYDPTWHTSHEIPFAGLTRGKPCFMLIEAWRVRPSEPPVAEADETSPPPPVEEIVGVAKVNLAPFLALASSSRTVRESVLHTDIARGAVPQWYTLLSAHETKFTCGRVQVSISFEAANKYMGAGAHSRSARVNGQGVAVAENGIANGADANGAGSKDANAQNAAVASTSAIASSSALAAGSQRAQSLLTRGYSYRDTKRDNHQFRVGNTTFDVPKRYQMIKAVGQGAYGCVIAASDTETGQALAIKNIPNAFNDLIDAKRILREIRLMRHLNHPNLVNLIDLIRPPSLHEFNDVYIVTDLMETDLHRVIHSNQSISDDHIQYFLYQMLLAVHYVHSAQVLHRDLKPSNILVNSDCDLKLCDFGLARGVHGLDSGLTEYVVTRWYRAPELLLSSKYDKQMDMWAIGCILAEMLGRRPLFPGHDYLHQLKIIMDVIGSPAEDSLDFITNPKAKRFILRQPKKPKVPLASVYPRATPACLDLLEKMLVFDPRKRITIAEALEHPYLSLVRDPALERTCPTPFDFAFENTELTKQKLQELIFEDVCAFHPDAGVIPAPATTDAAPTSSSSSRRWGSSSNGSTSAAASAASRTAPVAASSNANKTNASNTTRASTSTLSNGVPVATTSQLGRAEPSAPSVPIHPVPAASTTSATSASVETRPAPVALLPPNSVASAPPAPVVLLSPSTLPTVTGATANSTTAPSAPAEAAPSVSSPVEVALDIRDSVMEEAPATNEPSPSPQPLPSSNNISSALSAPVDQATSGLSEDDIMDAELEAIGTSGIHNVVLDENAPEEPAVRVSSPAADSGAEVDDVVEGEAPVDSLPDPSAATNDAHEGGDATVATATPEVSSSEIDLASSPTKKLLQPPLAAATPSSLV